MKKNNINVLHGHGSFVDNETIKIEKDGNSDFVKFEKAVIATGSKPALLPFVNIDKKRIITSLKPLIPRNSQKTFNYWSRSYRLRVGSGLF